MSNIKRKELSLIALMCFVLVTCAVQARGQKPGVAGVGKKLKPLTRKPTKLTPSKALKQKTYDLKRGAIYQNRFDSGIGGAYSPPTPAEREALQRAFELGLGNAEERVQQARTLFAAGKNSLAKVECEAALVVAPRFNGVAHAPDAKQLLGEINYSEGNYKQALYWFGDRAKNTRDDSQDFDIALCYVRMGDYQSAKRHYSHQLVYRYSSLTTAADLPVIRDLKSLEASILLARGLDHFVTSRRKQASADYDAAARLAPSNPWLQHQRGWIAIRAGRQEEGLALMRQAAVSNNPNILGDARSWLGAKEVTALRAARGLAK